MQVTRFHSCDICGADAHPDHYFCERHLPPAVKERIAIRTQIDDLEAHRNENYWRAHMQGSMSRYQPLPVSFYEERQRLENRLRELAA